jgi:hypothetical protein
MVGLAKSPRVHHGVIYVALSWNAVAVQDECGIKTLDGIWSILYLVEKGVRWAGVSMSLTTSVPCLLQGRPPCKWTSVLPTNCWLSVFVVRVLEAL